ncbi:MAG TPA: CDP-diacylglycerol--glycerol-3-phosphate 3-phosphatidyltransferase [Luteitalea sp.]|nr:CDP-diacylglycerol--glycerol-3-phosphate 3-phosphatidyltransferase [Luteitalea sp.]
MARVRRMINLPNALSLIRIVLVPLLVVVMLTPPRSWDWIGVRSDFLGAAIFGLASLTDFFDGWLARRRRQVTAVGQWLDPLADKLLVTGALISLVQLDRAPAWMVAIIVGRELAVTGLRSVATSRGVAMPASDLGKRKMAAQVTAILGLLLAPSVPFPLNWVGTVALWVMLALALWSAVDYYRRFNDVLKGE